MEEPSPWWLVELFLTLVGSGHSSTSKVRGALTLVGTGQSSSSQVMEEPLPWWVVGTHPAVRLWRSLTLVGSGHSSTSKIRGALTLVGSGDSSSSKVMEEPHLGGWWSPYLGG